jgi:hypothetical protein
MYYILLGELIGLQLVSKLQVLLMQSEGPLPLLQEPALCNVSKQVQFLVIN